MAASTPNVLITTQLPEEVATLEDAMRRLALSPEEVDTRYGLIHLPDGSFALLVTPEAADRVQGAPSAQGPFANPRSDTFGSPLASTGQPGQGADREPEHEPDRRPETP